MRDDWSIFAKGYYELSMSPSEQLTYSRMDRSSIDCPSYSGNACSVVVFTILTSASLYLLKRVLSNTKTIDFSID